VVRLETVPEHWPSGVPELDGEYLPATLKWWDAIWSGPVAKHWLLADVASLELLADLRDQVARGDGRAMLFREIRAVEDRFGLSPVSRRRLGWDVARGSPEVSSDASGGDDRWLRVVKDNEDGEGAA
jgi:hypothetical protein